MRDGYYRALVKTLSDAQLEAELAYLLARGDERLPVVVETMQARGLDADRVAEACRRQAKATV
jgi:hypothetical protein